MPWCEQCDRFYTPSTLTADGDCPSGHHVADREESPVLVQSDAPGRDEEERGRAKVRAPWHFWVLLTVLVIYLGWRLIQGINLLL